MLVACYLFLLVALPAVGFVVSRRRRPSVVVRLVADRTRFGAAMRRAAAAVAGVGTGAGFTRRAMLAALEYEQAVAKLRAAFGPHSSVLGEFERNYLDTVNSGVDEVTASRSAYEWVVRVRMSEKLGARRPAPAGVSDATVETGGLYEAAAMILRAVFPHDGQVLDDLSSEYRKLASVRDLTGEFVVREAYLRALNLARLRQRTAGGVAGEGGHD